ncbi:hypothetical protein C7S17_3233 [Burkholderia thailandensis]|nr:hypothetical protein [Burkholderia thailandensis]
MSCMAADGEKNNGITKAAHEALHRIRSRAIAPPRHAAA